MKYYFKKKVCWFSLLFMVMISFTPYNKEFIYATFGAIVLGCLAGHTISDIKEPKIKKEDDRNY